jgi:hypothetical protein
MKQFLACSGVSILMLWFVGCSSVPRHFSAAEQQLNTDGTITRAFHSVLYYPNQIALNGDGFIVGLEKSERDTVSMHGDVRVIAMPEVGFPQIADSEAKLSDRKIFYVSHIIKHDAGSNCPLYNLYAELSPDRSQFFDGCDAVTPWRIGAQERAAVARQAYARSWVALASLRLSLRDALRAVSGIEPRYTHVVVITMGWNTPQDEAVRNFNSIMRNFSVAMNADSRKARKPDVFRPLVIGVTWPSQWSSAWFDPVLKLFSFSSKAEDADQIGLSWLGVLMHEIVPGAIHDAGTGTSVIAIGHSFGSRALSTAVCAGPVIYNTAPAPVRSTDQTVVKHLINYQGAFLSKRMFERVSEYGMHYPQGCPNAAHLALTASASDTANTRPFWGAYAGESKAYDIQCGDTVDPIDCRFAHSTGELAPSGRPVNRIVYVNADALIVEMRMTRAAARTAIFSDPNTGSCCARWSICRRTIRP